jgi:hypothetical protein
MKMAILIFTAAIGKCGGKFKIQNPQMFETDPESFSPAIYFRTTLLSNQMAPKYSL